MASAEFKYEILIREFHLDTFGHVNNAAYFQIFEEARWDFLLLQTAMEPLGSGAPKAGPGFARGSDQVQKELKLREKIIVRSRTLPFEGKIGKIEQQMLKPDGSVACEATFVVGFFDLAARKLIEPTPEWMRAIGLA